jgi:hypothetical protein
MIAGREKAFWVGGGDMVGGRGRCWTMVADDVLLRKARNLLSQVSNPGIEVPLTYRSGFINEN